MSASIVQTASDRDAIWFFLHPRRTVRVRPYVEGEMPVSMPWGDGIPAVIVRQLRPGVRARIPAYLPAMPANTERACLAVLRRFQGGVA